MADLKRALFGGTFDPIHFGHLILAVTIQEELGLDEVLFCPASISPFKKKMPPKASSQDRLAMVRKATEAFEAFSVIDLEVEKGGPSYTIDTVRALQAKKEGVLYLMITSEATELFDKWKEASELKKLVKIVVGTRGVFQKENKNFIYIHTPAIEICSTIIRKRLLEKKNCHHLVPSKALDYIYENDLYSNS